MDTTTTPTITLDHPGLNDAERQAALALMHALDAYRAERGFPPSAVVTLHAKDVAVSQTIAERLEGMLFERMANPLVPVPAALFDAVGRARDRHRKALTAFTLCLQAPTLAPAAPGEFTGDPVPTPGNANLRIGETRGTAQPMTTSAIHREVRPPANAGPRPWEHTPTNEHSPEALAKGDGESRGTAPPVTNSAIHRQAHPAATPLRRSLGKDGWPTPRDSANRTSSAQPGASPAVAPVDPPSHRFPMNAPAAGPVKLAPRPIPTPQKPRPVHRA